MPFLPSIPGIGSTADADCIFVQALGRNSFPDEGLGKGLAQLRRKAGPHDLKAFNHMKAFGFDPGESNRALARMAMKRSGQLRIPIIAQWEVVYAIWEMNSGWYVHHLNKIDCLWPPEGGYFSTRDVKIMSKERMLARGCRRPLEMAHPAMIARAVTILWKLGISPIVEPVSVLDFWKSNLWVWDKKSVQPWTRGLFHLPDLDLPVGEYIKGLREVWIVREWLGRIHHIVHRWVGIIPPATA
jgi:hypothetical protein